MQVEQLLAIRVDTTPTELVIRVRTPKSENRAEL